MEVRNKRPGGKVALIALAGALSLASVPFIVANAQSTTDTTKEVALPGWQIQFENINPAIKMATVYGDRANGAHGTFGTFPPNFITPVHTHTAAYNGVVVKGVMTNPFQGQDAPPTLEAGSFWHVPAGSAHATACVSNVPCEFYFHAEAGFDFHVVEK